jgi:VanZ family protein
VDGLAPWSFAWPDLAHYTWLRVLPFIHYFLRTDVYALADAVLQALLYLPLGALLAARPRGVSLAASAAAGLGVAALVEAGQVFAAGRVADVTDAAVGGAGAAVGAWIWRRAQRERAEASPAPVPHDA